MADNESIERLDVQALQSALSDAGASWHRTSSRNCPPRNESCTWVSRPLAT